jgi:hypothetical protein
MENIVIFFDHVEYFTAIWYILLSIGAFFPVLVCCTKKKFSTLKYVEFIWFWVQRCLCTSLHTQLRINWGEKVTLCDSYHYWRMPVFCSLPIWLVSSNPAGVWGGGLEELKRAWTLTCFIFTIKVSTILTQIRISQQQIDWVCTYICTCLHAYMHTYLHYITYRLKTVKISVHM